MLGMMKATLLLGMIASTSAAQVVDFETLPGGAPTLDEQTISDEYLADFGVRFDIVDGTTLAPIGLPLIAKVGSPQTAFAGCGPDTPLDGEGVGDSFLTDDNQVSGADGALLLTLSAPSAAAAGVILDVDTRPGSTFEEWTVQALDASMNILETIVITAPDGPDVCTNNYGPGDARATGFAFERPSADISFIVLRYTGTAGSVGLAFDAFSPTSIPVAPTASISASTLDDLCDNDPVLITSNVSGGLPGIRYQWQIQESNGQPFVDIDGERSSTLVAPARSGVSYRLAATDALGRVTTTTPVTIGATMPLFTTLRIETAPMSGVFTPVSTNIKTYIFDESIETVFDWSGNEQFYHGAEPPLSTDRAHLFLSSGAGGQSLVMVFDIADAPNAGGRAEMVLAFSGATPDYTMRDDPNDLYRDGGTDTLRTRHNWNSPNTDGWAVGPLAGTWSATVSFSDVFTGTPTIDGLTSWSFFSADGTSYTLPLVEDQRVRITTACGCAPDLDNSGSLDFGDASTFLTAFAADDLSVDFDDSGSLDFGDVSAFLTLFAAGCP